MKKIFAIIILLLCFGIKLYAQQPVLQEGLALKYLVQPPANKYARIPVIILLHGYGSDEKDLFELRSMLPDNYLIVAARAPYALPGGGYEWYEGKSVNGKRDGDKVQLDGSRDNVIKFITQITNKYKADPKNVYVIGFSQGAIMSYEVGLTAPDKVKGIGVLSGMLFESLKPSMKNTAELKKLKIFIAHGTTDDRITFANGKAAVDYLISIGLKPDFHSYPGIGHTITNVIMNDLLHWLK